MFLMMFGVTQSYFWIALTWSLGKGRTLGTQRIHREFLEHLMQFYQGRWGGGWWFQQKSINVSKRMYFQNLNEQIRVGGAKNVVYDNTNHRGSRMVFLIMSSIVNLKEHQNVDDDHDTFVERFHEVVTDRRWHQVKWMMKRKLSKPWYETNLKSSLLFKDKWYDEEDRRRISSPSNFFWNYYVTQQYYHLLCQECRENFTTS